MDNLIEYLPAMFGVMSIIVAAVLVAESQQLDNTDI